MGEIWNGDIVRGCDDPEDRVELPPSRSATVSRRPSAAGSWFPLAYRLGGGFDTCARNADILLGSF